VPCKFQWFCFDNDSNIDFLDCYTEIETILILYLLLIYAIGYCDSTLFLRLLNNTCKILKNTS